DDVGTGRRRVGELREGGHVVRGQDDGTRPGGGERAERLLVRARPHRPGELGAGVQAGVRQGVVTGGGDVGEEVGPSGVGEGGRVGVGPEQRVHGRARRRGEVLDGRRERGLRGGRDGGRRRGGRGLRSGGEVDGRRRGDEQRRVDGEVDVRLVERGEQRLEPCCRGGGQPDLRLLGGGPLVGSRGGRGQHREGHRLDLDVRPPQEEAAGGGGTEGPRGVVRRHLDAARAPRRVAPGEREVVGRDGEREGQIGRAHV